MGQFTNMLNVILWFINSTLWMFYASSIKNSMPIGLFFLAIACTYGYLYWQGRGQWRGAR